MRKSGAAILVFAVTLASACSAGDDSPASADSAAAAADSTIGAAAPSPAVQQQPAIQEPAPAFDTARTRPPVNTGAQPTDPPPAIAGETQKAGGTMGPRVPPPTASRERDSAIQPKFEIGTDGKVRPIKR
ncbi:MAG TPA: hypothetical protein VM939_15075 [Gemmatimonadaceae bacterium]|nr:hypothetical protein [Gemmatimonadaceae bacterium]